MQDITGTERGKMHNEKTTIPSFSYPSWKEKGNTNLRYGKTAFTHGKNSENGKTRGGPSVYSAVLNYFQGGEVAEKFIIYSFIE